MINNVNRDFKRHIKRAGIRPVGSLTIHTLRKACIMNWANNLPIFVTKEYAGHSNISTTQEYYTLVDSDHDLKAQRVIQELLESQESVKSDAQVTPESVGR